MIYTNPKFQIVTCVLRKLSRYIIQRYCETVQHQGKTLLVYKKEGFISVCVYSVLTEALPYTSLAPLFILSALCILLDDYAHAGDYTHRFKYINYVHLMFLSRQTSVNRCRLLLSDYCYITILKICYFPLKRTKCFVPSSTFIFFTFPPFYRVLQKLSQKAFKNTLLLGFVLTKSRFQIYKLMKKIRNKPTHWKFICTHTARFLFFIIITY